MHLFYCFKACCAVIVTASIALADTPIEIQTFWTSPGEQRAFAELVKHGREAGLNIEPVFLESYATLREQTARRMAIGIPPEVSHWVGGGDQQLLAGSGNLLPVPEFVAGQRIEDVLFSEVLEEISSNGTPYGIPVGVHLQSIVVYNKPLLARVGYDALPDTWDEFFEMSEALEAEGIRPFAGSSHYWLLQNLLSSILISVGGRTAYNDFYGEPFDASGTLKSTLEEAFEIFWRFRDMVDDDHIDRYWADMVNMVVDGDAAYTLIGDYAWSEIAVNAAGRTEDFSCAAPPNTRIAHYAVDIFVGFDTGEDAWRNSYPVLFDTIVAPETQVDYLAFKGGLPVSRLVETETLNHCSSASLDLWLNAEDGRMAPLDRRDTTQLAALVDALIELWFDKEISSREAADILYDRVYDLSDNE